MKIAQNYVALFLIVAGLTAYTKFNYSGRIVSGLVTSEVDGTPLEGVTVAVKGGLSPSGTQADGMYYLPVSEKDSLLVFSEEGFKAQEIRLTATNQYNVVLHKLQGSSIDKARSSSQE